MDQEGIRRLQDRFLGACREEQRIGGFQPKHRMRSIPWISARISRAAFQKIQHHRNVAIIEADIPIYARLGESAPQIGADRVWDFGYDGQGVNVAVLDSGIDTDHPDLIDSLVWEECFLSDGVCPAFNTDIHRASGPGSAEDGDGHGSMVSGIITSDSATYRGVAPGAGIVAIKILDNDGSGMLSDLVAALDWVAMNQDAFDIRIVNMSLGSGIHEGVCDPSYASIAEAAQEVKNSGVVLFAASGNEGEDTGIDMPACLSSVISVGAVYDDDVRSPSYPGVCSEVSTEVDQIACFSNASSALDLLAPGANIFSSFVGGGIAGSSGTSLACPHAAATAALLLEAEPELSPDEILSKLISYGLPIYDDRIQLWFPRVDAVASIQFSLSDLDGDGDVDGEDLFAHVNEQNSFSMDVFSSIFGRILH